MRNLKRVFSLGMTAAMISSLMVVSSSAASYKDVTSEENQEAIEVLKEVGIMVGDDNGNFNPDSKVTRNEMAVIVSNLMAYNVASYKGTSPFTDVPSWAEPYVAACYTNGNIAGYTSTYYGGSDNVTTAQAALMLMKALGYFQYQSDFEGDWQLATTKQGNKIDLFDDVDANLKEAITRNDLAQLVLNTLESGTVEADDDTIKVITDGATVEAGKVNYNYVTSSKDYADAIDTDLAADTGADQITGNIVQLGEKLFNGDLTKKGTSDAFGRPADRWEYKAKEIGTYADDADYVFTAKVTSKDLYDAVKKTAAEDYDWSVYTDGDLVSDFSNTKLVANKSDDDKDFNEKQGSAAGKLTGNGVITEVFVDGSKGEESVTVVSYHQYAAEVLKVDEDDGTITLSDLSGADSDKTADPKDEYDSTDFDEDDIVIYTYADGEIQSVYAATKVEGDVSSVSVKTNNNNTDGKNSGTANEGDKFVVDGTTYKYNATMKASDMLDTDNVNNEVVAYTDSTGYVAYIDASAVTYDYAYVLSMGTDGSKYGTDNSGKTVYARLVLTDGTMIKVETDADVDEIGTEKSDGSYEAKDSSGYLLNHIVSYTKDKNDVYTLTDRSYKAIKSAQSDSSLDIQNDKASFTANGSWTANANTVFIVADPDEKLDDYDYTVYTGVKNVPGITGQKNTKVVVAAKTGTVAKVVYIEDADVSGTGDIIFARADRNPDYTNDGSTKIFHIKAVVNGEVQTLDVKDGTTAADILVPDSGDLSSAAYALSLDSNDRRYLVALKSITTNSDGYVVSVKLYDETDKTKMNDDTIVVTGEGMDKSKDDVVTLYYNSLKNGTSMTWDDEVQVAHYNDKNNSYALTSGKIRDIKDDYNEPYIAVIDEGVLVGICTVYVEGTGTAPSEAAKADKITDDGTAESASLNISGSKIEVIDRYNTGKTADALAREALADAKFTVNSTSGDYYFVTAPNGQAYTLQLDATTLYPVTLKVGDDEKNVDITSPTTIYMAKGESVTVQLTNSGEWKKDSYTVTPSSSSSSSSWKAGSATKDSSVKTVVTFKLTASADITSAETVTLSWS